MTKQLTLLVNLSLISLYSPSVQLLGGMAVASLVFKEIAINLFQSGCAILPLQQQCMRDPACPYSHQDLVLSLFFSFLLFSCSVVSDSLPPYGLQHARLPCLSLFPRVCSNSCPLSWWCHPAVLSSVALFFSYPQSLPASGSFPVVNSASDGQSIGASASSISPSNEYSRLIFFRTDLFDLCSPRDSQESSPAHSSFNMHSPDD